MKYLLSICFISVFVISTNAQKSLQLTPSFYIHYSEKSMKRMSKLFHEMNSNQNPFPSFYQGKQIKDSARENYITSIKLKNYHVESLSYRCRGKVKLFKIDIIYDNKANELYNKNEYLELRRGIMTSLYSHYRVYRNNEKIQEEASYNKHNRLDYKILYTYDSVGFPKEAIQYRGWNIKYYSRTTHEWYPDGRPRLITYYTNKEYKPEVDSYECQPEGTRFNKHQDTTTICNSTEVDAEGNIVTNKIERNEKGQEYKTIKRFNKADKLCSEERYNSKGEYEFGLEFVYNEKGQNTSFKRFGYGKVLEVRQEDTYNDKGLLINSRYFNKQNELIGETQVLYDADNHIVKSDEKDYQNKRTEIKHFKGNCDMPTEVVVEFQDPKKNKKSFYRFIREYDSSNNIIKEAKYDISNNIVWSDSYEYNSNRNLIREVKSGENNIQLKVTKYTYNTNELVEKVEEYNEKNELKSLITFTFEYCK